MKTVLVIEDETQTRNIFLKCLEFEGFGAFGAASGMAGVALAKNHRPDLVVCDIIMPDMDGYSVLSALRKSQDTASIPLIFLTAKVTLSDLRRGMEMGADDYLTKPCTVEQFLAAIGSRLKRHEELSLLYGQSASAIPLETTIGKLSEADSPQFFPDCPKLAAVFQFIEAHFAQPVNLSDVAQAVGYSPAYLTNLVQTQTGRTVKRWIIQRRMAQARDLLTNTTQSVQQIAESAGYQDAGYFIRQFRQFHGASPQIWRQKSVTKSTK
ncbi:MAG: response regulator transcription factor [Leptolyngbyaceae cyanobacterium SL_1_1]|nr:response regulator transcription factor [Leptolyngbyaceae cyanobacterium RM1_1_2]NJO10143.1 response regulator transcription factor [Leptolyngbyaceae cyanobacterium SL_1_1]